MLVFPSNREFGYLGFTLLAYLLPLKSKGKERDQLHMHPQGSESWPSSTPPLGFSLLQRALSGANSSEPARSPDAFSFGGGESGGGVSCVCPVGNTKTCPQISYSASKSAQEFGVSQCSVLTECRPAARPASALQHRPRLFLVLSGCRACRVVG